MTLPFIGVIGGTGLGEALSADDRGEVVEVDTPFGAPSSPIIVSHWGDQRVAFLLRHGPGHRLNPSQVPYRANLFAFKALGITHIIASGATGSLREEIAPGHLVLADQVIDKTYRRDNTFFDHDIAVHVEFAEPFCPALRQTLRSCRDHVATTIHDGGVYVCMEGPQFSTVAESRLHRGWGAQVIGMTCMPEARLAREAEICYALVALATDYDCWRPHPPGTHRGALLEEILGNLRLATGHAIELIRAAVTRLATTADMNCPCRDALRLGIWSERSGLDGPRLAPLKPLLGRYLQSDDTHR